MGDDSQRIHYHASRTVVNISGVLTTTTEDSGETVTERASEVTVGTSADPNASLELVFKEHWGKDREFEIKLTADERLAGATAGTKGAGAQILGAALSLVPLVGALVLPAMVAKKVTSVEEEFDAEARHLLLWLDGGGERGSHIGGRQVEGDKWKGTVEGDGLNIGRESGRGRVKYRVDITVGGIDVPWGLW